MADDPGTPLSSRLAEGPLSLAEVLDLTRQLAGALTAAHEQGVVMGPLVPTRLFVAPNGQLTIAPAPEETSGYASPEQVRGEPPDARSDLFCFGVLGYELLAGHPAFAGESPEARARLILEDEPVALPRRGEPPALARLIWQCLDKDPTRRFQSARDLAFYLEMLSDPTEGATPYISHGPRRHRPPLVMVGFLVVLATATAFAWIAGRKSGLAEHRATPPPAAASQPR